MGAFTARTRHTNACATHMPCTYQAFSLFATGVVSHRVSLFRKYNPTCTALCTTPALNASTSRGCMYLSAANYNASATEDDGSCVFDCVADGGGSSSCEATELCSGNGGHCRRLFAGGVWHACVHLHLHL